MKIYQDRGLTEEINILDLGVVLAGEKEQFTFYVFNEENAHVVNLEFILEQEQDEAKIIESPKELQAQAMGELIVEYAPNVTLKEGLRCRVELKWQELWS